MTSHPIFETTLALILVFALLSLLVSSLMEFWSYYRKARGKMLREAIHQLLKDPLNKNYGELVMEHFLIKNLTNSFTQRPPQYISANLFSEALIDVIAQQARHTSIRLKLPKAGEKGLLETAESYDIPALTISKEVMTRFKAGLESMEPSPLRDAFFSMYDKSSEDPQQLKARLELWYNDYMETVTGWYKSSQMKRSIFFGFLVACFLNVDSIYLFKVLSMDSQMRGELVEVAEQIAQDYQELADSTRRDNAALRQIAFQHASDSLFQDSLFRKIQFQDTLANQALAQADSILGVVYSLNIPIGWSKNSAPASWMYAQDSTVTTAVKDSKGIIAYNHRRNSAFSIWYFIGIGISGVALGMGAPFWFDILVKLVNLRLAGNKPAGNPKYSKS